MNEHVDEGPRVALEYYRAWAAGEHERAWGYLAPDVECQTPAGVVKGAAAYAEFFGAFATRVKRVELLAAHGSGGDALLMYDADTDIRDGAAGAEWITVADGRITKLWLIFDRLPFAQARGQVGG